MEALTRVSIGTAAVLGLRHCKLDAIPTTAYFMTYSSGRCSANCAFCAQARSSQAPSYRLSRVSWPIFSLSSVISKLSNLENSPFQRLCIQTICYPRLEQDLFNLVETFHNALPSLPISVALPPFPISSLQRLKASGVERVAISLDATTSTLFKAIKGAGVNGPFSWEEHLKALENTQRVFGFGSVTTHLILGLGETEKEAITCIQQLVDRGLSIGLFPFTPIPGTPLSNHPRPLIEQYRRIQLAQYIIINNLAGLEQMNFDPQKGTLIDFGLSKRHLVDIINRGIAFQTVGCPGCNRPFFTEQPGGPIYNYPEPPTPEILQEIRYQLIGVL